MSAPIPRTTRNRVCAYSGCGELFDDFYRNVHWPRAYCSPLCHLRATAKPVPDPKPRAQLRRSTTPAKRQPISAASPEQRAKRNNGASIVSGETRGLDAAHLCPRGLGGCDDPLCVVPLTRAEHVAFDRADPQTGKRLDLLPYLVAHGCHAELAHALGHYRGDLIALLERVTGEKWMPVQTGET